MRMNQRLLTAVLAASLTLLAWPVIAQTYPAKPIKIVVPFPAGGTSDVLARMIGQKMSERWGQPVVVDNKPGSSGNLGADAVAKSAPDGYTLVLMDVGNLVISPALYKLPFNVEKTSRLWPWSAIRHTCWWSATRFRPTPQPS